MSRATYFRTKKDKNNPYVMIDKRPIENPDLSWKAKGMLAYLLSRPDDWEIWIEDLINRSTDGKDSVKAGLMELVDAGHIKYIGRAKREGGRFQRAVWEVYEVPVIHHSGKSALVDVPNSGKSAVKIAENPPHTNTKTNIKDKRSKFRDPVWDALHGVDPDPAMVLLLEQEQKAIESFESAFQLQRPWDWYPTGKDEKTWRDFRAYVVKLYGKDPDCFSKYMTWSRQLFVKGSMTALGIKRNPENFPDSWSAYLVSPMYSELNQSTEEQDDEQTNIRVV